MREWEFDEGKQAAEEDSNATLESDAGDKKKRLEQWSVSAYGEVRIRTLTLLTPLCLPLFRRLGRYEG